MRGLRQIWFVGCAAVFRALAWLPLAVSKVFERIADECERKAREG